jgi:hypothetical protein
VDSVWIACGGAAFSISRPSGAAAGAQQQQRRRATGAEGPIHGGRVWWRGDASHLGVGIGGWRQFVTVACLPRLYGREEVDHLVGRRLNVGVGVGVRVRMRVRVGARVGARVRVSRQWQGLGQRRVRGGD